MKEKHELPEGKMHIALEVPYLAIYDHLIASSSSGENLVDRINNHTKDTEAWDKLINELKHDESMDDRLIFSFARVNGTQDFAVSLLMLDASDTHSLTSNKVMFTPSRVLASYSLLKEAWSKSPAGYPDIPHPLDGLNKEEFLSVVNSFPTMMPIVQVSDSMAYLHGTFSKDTWTMLSSILGRSTTTKIYAETTGCEDKVYGTMVLFGNLADSLFTVCESVTESAPKHISEDLSLIAESFRKKDENEQ